MCLPSTYFYTGALWVLASVLTVQPVEPLLVQQCMEYEGRIEPVRFRCESPREVIELVGVTLWQAVSYGDCDSQDEEMPRYECDNMVHDIETTVHGRCNAKRTCRYVPTYPDLLQCPGIEPITLYIHYKCVPRSPGGSDDNDDDDEDVDDNDDDDDDMWVWGHTSVPTTPHTHQDNGASVIGAAVGGTLAGILATVIVVLVIVLLRRKRSRSKSELPREPMTMKTMLPSAPAQPKVFDYNRDANDSLAEDYRISGYYMEIEDADLDAKMDSKMGNLSQTNSPGGGRNYQGISDLHPSSPMDGVYEEIPDIVSDLPSAQTGMAYGSPRDMTSRVAVPDENAHRRDNIVIRDAKNMTSLQGNDHKPLSIVKSADETVLEDNDIYEG